MSAASPARERSRSPWASRRCAPRPHAATHAIAVASLGAWAAISILSQHPLRLFDNISRRCRLGPLIPDWRFFAPEPSRHDHHLLVRVRGFDGVPSPWRVAHEFTPRAWWQMFWFPAHRHEKALFDVCSALQLTLTETGEDIATSVPYELLRGFVERAVRTLFPVDPGPQGFQFVLLKAGGHDIAEHLDYQLVSPFTALTSPLFDDSDDLRRHGR